MATWHIFDEETWFMVQVKSAFLKAYSVLTDAKLITSLGPNRSILGTIVRPDSVLLDRKGWNTDGVLADMLAEPWEPLPQRFDSENDALYNWHALDDDEPLPRNTQPVSEDTSSSPLGKRKSSSKSKKKSRKKAKADASSSDDNDEEGSRNGREHSRGKGSAQSEKSRRSGGSSRRRKGTREYDRFTNTLPQYTHISRWWVVCCYWWHSQSVFGGAAEFDGGRSFYVIPWWHASKHLS